MGEVPATDFRKPPKRPPGAQALNLAGRALSAVGIHTPAFTVQAVTDAAIRTAGDRDFGSDSYLAALAPLLHSLEHEAQLNQLGRIVLKGQIVSALASRLTVVAWEKANPELAAAPVTTPLIIVGMPRTGTTILYETLAAAPHLRAPLTWECRDYALAHEITDPQSDPRIEKLGRAMSRMDRLMPGFSAIHYFDPFIPTECVGLTILDLCSEQFPALAWAPTYRDFLLSSDFKSAYSWHKRGLRYSQAGWPG
ncbi:MAG: sulfotransferase, partial [Pseudomonadota bacterium]